MTGFPILMYYLWICLVFCDGQLVHPKSLDDIQPFLWRMWEHVRVVSVKQIASTRIAHMRTGCKPECLRLESLLRVLLLPALYCLHSAWVPAGRSSGPIARIQNSHVQLQCALVSVRDYGNCGGPACYEHLPSHYNHRELWTSHDRCDHLRLCRELWHVFLDYCTG